MIIVFALCWLALLALTIRAALKRSRPRQVYAQSTTPPASVNALTALQQQREIIADLISDIDLQLDAAPANREKLLKDKAALYSKLAMVEQRINKLIA